MTKKEQQEKLRPMNLFRTPENWAEITNFITTTGDPHSALIVAAMAWNLACKEGRE
jgi:hypothetical protein